MRRALLAALCFLHAPLVAWGQGQDKVIDVRAARPPGGNTFEALWAAYRKADQGGDAENSQKLFEEIRRLRVERNIPSLEPVAMALVAQGLDRLSKGDRDAAEKDFRGAAGLDPYLPDAYFGLALADAKKGPLGIPNAIKDTLSGLAARLPTSRGRFYTLGLLIPVGLLAAWATATVLASSLLLRHGTLLLHDLEESFGPGKPRSFAMGVYAILLLLPVITFQGYGWLPLWWLALLFVYLGKMEKVVALLGCLMAVCAGPATKVLEAHILAQENPLFRAGVLAIEGGPDARAIADLEKAVRVNADDRDLVYLLALQYKKAGRYDDAATVYREILRAEPKDGIALNNLANIEFARAEFQAAIARYKQGAAAAATPEVGATLYYNLSLAHLQRFEYEPNNEARAQADRLARSVTQAYESRWKFDKEGSAVAAAVDLGLTQDELWAKFAGVREGIGRKNVAGKNAGAESDLAAGALTRFTGFLGVFGFTVFGLQRWRGRKMFTMRCPKCGTPFCKHCHLGAAAAGLCTQCYHLFVVRDGVSGPARNQKLLEVQKEDERRERVFRALSLLSPGAGHLYAQKTLAGVVFVWVWYGIVALALLAGRLLPVTETPAALSSPWALVLAGLLLLATYVVANRARPDFEVAMPVRRSGPSGARRGRAS